MKYSGPVIPRSHLERFRPDLSWFVRDGRGIHGIGHESRVLIWTQVLASMIKDDGWDITLQGPVLGWTAAIHDTQRHDDGRDVLHGERAAEWLLARPRQLPDGSSAESIAYLCRWHVPGDPFAPELTMTLRAFKDADALDRCRIGDLNPHYLRVPHSRQLVELAEHLWSKTRRAGFLDPETAFDEVMAEALAMRIVSDT